VQKVFVKLFFFLQCGFVIFWQQKIGVKAAYKKLVKLKKGVNFINLLHAHFPYECLFGSFSLVTCKLKKLPKRLSYVKFVQKTLVKLTIGCSLGLFAGIFMSAKVVEKWNNKPMFVSFDTIPTPIWDIPFPAVTICNVENANINMVIFNETIFS
jgi:hypothetical protein